MLAASIALVFLPLVFALVLALDGRRESKQALQHLPKGFWLRRLH
jgi:hypothetical protein